MGGSASTLWFEDYHVGHRFTTDTVTLGADAVIAFARDYDPQPMHLDPEAAAAGPFGGLIASGFQTIALTFRLFLDTGALAGSSLGGAGMGEVRWLHPVRPGDVLRAEVEVMDTRSRPERPDRGTVRLRFVTRNGDGDAVLSFETYTLLRRRPT